MSAREALIRSVYATLSQNQMAQRVDAFAHELAEQIRAEIRQLKADGVLGPNEDWAASDAADLIDPKTEKP